MTQNAPAIIEVPEVNETFKSGASAAFLISPPGRLGSEIVVQQFENSWRSTTTCPQVRAIYKVVSTQKSVNKYNVYRYAIAPPSVTRSTTPHGTRLQICRRIYRQLHQQGSTTRQREPAVAWDAQKVHPRRQRLHDLLFRRPMSLVLYHQDLVRCSLQWDKIGPKVRCRDLHFLHIFRVCIPLSP